MIVPFFSADPLKFCKVRWGVSLHSYFQVYQEMLDQAQALAGPLKDVQDVVLKPLLLCLGCVLKVVVLLEGEPSPQSEVLNALVSHSMSLKNILTACSYHHHASP